VTNARRVKTVQPGLRDDDRPVGMPVPRLTKNAQHRMLGRIRHLHHNQQQM